MECPYKVGNIYRYLSWVNSDNRNFTVTEIRDTLDGWIVFGIDPNGNKVNVSEWSYSCLGKDLQNGIA